MAKLATFCKDCCFFKNNECLHGLLDVFKDRGANIILEEDSPVIDRVCQYRKTLDWNVDKNDAEKISIRNDEVYIKGTIIVIANDIEKLKLSINKLNDFHKIKNFKIIVIYNKIKSKELLNICSDLKTEYKCMLYFNDLNLQIYRSLEFAKNGFLFIIDSNQQIQDDLIDKVNYVINKKLFRVLHISNDGNLHESVNMIHMYKYIKGDLDIPIRDKLLDIEEEEKPAYSQVFSWKEIDEQYSN